VATSHATGAAELALPVFADADPSRIPAVAMQLSFAPDPVGGIEARVAGLIDPAAATQAVVLGIQQMVAQNPLDHVELGRMFDTNHDGQLSSTEILSNTVVQALLSPDVKPLGGKAMSFGFGLHLVPCDAGTCGGVIADPCHDRIRDGDETGVDCGGSCGACPGLQGCATGVDCQSGVCDAGTCTTPSCTDGHRDGFESDIDCGGTCGGCAPGRTCRALTDCLSDQCDASTCL
jgi:hypothetical protein